MAIDTATRQVVYPESDGQPMADNARQFRWITIIKGGLDTLFRDRDDVFVAGDLLWYPMEGAATIRRAPDAMVVFGRPKGDRGSYLQWLEGDIAPQVVFKCFRPATPCVNLRRNSISMIPMVLKSTTSTIPIRMTLLVGNAKGYG
jgi:hypothetical protein